ncbi:transposable element Tcb1 transposase [Trichonephila clavipes]|nr:transposable element Tcb1 transposase [Trichonephila clavipes]
MLATGLEIFNHGQMATMTLELVPTPYSNCLTYSRESSSPKGFRAAYQPSELSHQHQRKNLLSNDNTKIHWCAKIKDEVEKLAYQLNEEAERTERPIRRLSKVMYGSTCADMQVDVMGECLSSIKHVAGTTSGDFYPRSNHWEVGGRPQCDKCGCRVRIAHSIVSRLWKQFQTTGTAIRGSEVVVHEEPHPQMTGTLSYRPEETGGRQREKSLDTRHRRQRERNRDTRPTDITFYRGQKTARWWSVCTTPCTVCTFNACPSEKAFSVVPGTPELRDNEWGRVLFTDESRFSLCSDSHRILIWRERGSRNYPSNIIERDRYGGRGVLVWGGIMLGNRTDLHIFDAGSVNGTRYCNEILLPYVRLFRGAMGLQFLFMGDNAPCHRTVAAEQLLESRRLAARTLPPVTIRELRLALQDEWAEMPQQLIDTLILGMGRRCETYLAVRGDHIPY